MRTSIALLSMLVVGIFVAAARPAFAQGGWSGSTPTFESDTRRADEQAEAERAARRFLRPRRLSQAHGRR
jgi:hypothetical protein